MKVVRNEVGNFENLGVLKSFDLLGISSDDYGHIVFGLSQAIQLYEEKGWNKKENSLSLFESYEGFKKIYAVLSDYKNHERTFNGKKVKK